MPAPDAIAVPQLAQLIGTPDAPLIIDVRLAEDRAADPRLLPTTTLRSHADVADWAPGFVAPSEVAAAADRFGATPFDIEDVAWSHRGPLWAVGPAEAVATGLRAALDRTAVKHG